MSQRQRGNAVATTGERSLGMLIRLAIRFAHVLSISLDLPLDPKALFDRSVVQYHTSSIVSGQPTVKPNGTKLNDGRYSRLRR